VLPGLRTSAAITSLVVLALIVFPLTVLVLRAASLGPAGFSEAAWTPRARAAYAVSLSASVLAALASSLLGLLVALGARPRAVSRSPRFSMRSSTCRWPCPTAVARPRLTRRSTPRRAGSGSGSCRWASKERIPVFSASRSVLVFVSLPFAIRVVQPVIESLDRDIGGGGPDPRASRLQTFFRVVLPAILPAVVTGFALALARALGEYGLGRLHLGQHAIQDGDIAGAHRVAARGVCLRRGHDRGRAAPGDVTLAARARRTRFSSGSPATPR